MATNRDKNLNTPMVLEMIEESDFDDTDNDPSYETETGEASSSDDNKHTRWKTSNPIRWKKNVRKRLYKNGKEHMDTSGKHKKQKAPKHTPSNKTSEEPNQDLSISKMYQLYKLHCDQLVPPKTDPVEELKYRRLFCTEYNLSFFHPKKDQCMKYSKHKILTGIDNVNFEEEYQAHLQRSKEAQAAKSSDKLRATKDSNFISTTFDLQSVLQLPNTNASLLYYSRKLSLYNLCIYNAAKPNDAFCYCWNEVQAGRGSNEIGTAVYNWLSDLPSNIREAIKSSTNTGKPGTINRSIQLLYPIEIQSSPEPPVNPPQDVNPPQVIHPPIMDPKPRRRAALIADEKRKSWLPDLI
ncbi:hypothetical protein LOTGIDRAFT_174457 [Lottia gigantea]|uniref:Uncharacterized protein n=1 Tax=Lottia gigantea TaxID=225164 RepID=V4AT09_LOTGI|nr:hypothetical protein LOTGIDRAFT_174457 [Lottia gigantea]ESO98020.1 hypothetical protein LOTGIDRAFT_174457 [Lottia gigantea]